MEEAQVNLAVVLDSERGRSPCYPEALEPSYCLAQQGWQWLSARSCFFPRTHGCYFPVRCRPFLEELRERFSLTRRGWNHRHRKPVSSWRCLQSLADVLGLSHPIVFETRPQIPPSPGSIRIVCPQPLLPNWLMVCNDSGYPIFVAPKRVVRRPRRSWPPTLSRYILILRSEIYGRGMI